jgi:hypothetical protein
VDTSVVNMPPCLPYLLALLALYMKALKKMLLENKPEHFVADSYESAANAWFSSAFAAAHRQMLS